MVYVEDIIINRYESLCEKSKLKFENSLKMMSISALILKTF